MMKRLVVLQEEHLILGELERLRPQAEAMLASPPPLPPPSAEPAAVEPPPERSAPAVYAWAPPPIIYQAPPPVFDEAPAASLPASAPPATAPAAPAPEAEPPLDAGVVGLHAVARAAALKAERLAILEALAQFRWNRRKVADYLDVSYKTLLTKMKECGISDPGGAA